MVTISRAFLISVPRVSVMQTRERFKTVGRAVVRLADLLGADIEVSQKKNLLSVWVYYKNGEQEWNPVYFDWGKDWDEDDVFNSIRNEVCSVASHHESVILQSA